jgi:hypothetical protein
MVGLLNAYAGDDAMLMEVACVHSGHADDSRAWACFMATVITEFLRAPQNRAAVLKAMAGAEQPAQ